jgi:Uma2 family endonuclease
LPAADSQCSFKAGEVLLDFENSFVRFSVMATARKPAASLGQPENVAQLLRRLGNIPACRLRLQPPPGTATERDLVRHNESKSKTAICELVDGTLVEKAMGWVESAIAAQISSAILSFARPRKLGKVLGADGMLRLIPGLVRVPDVSFFAQGRLTRAEHGDMPIAPITGDLVVEVDGRSNTKAETARKLNEYFAAGSRLAWVVDPKPQTVRVHTAPGEYVVLGLEDWLDGGGVLPGFRLQVRDLFESDE